MTTEGKRKLFMPVKDYAISNQISVQAVYKMIKMKKLIMRKIGSYILVQVP